MAEINFVIHSKNAVAKIKESEIRIINSRFCRGIVIPFSILFPKITDQQDWNSFRKGRWNSFDGSVNLEGINEAIFFFNNTVNRDLFDDFDINSDLILELTPEKIHQIEKIRSGDLELKLRANIHLEFQNDYKTRLISLLNNKPNRENDELNFFTTITKFPVELNFRIAKSFWVESILSNIYKPFRLIQIPIINSRIGKACVEELLKAEEYFLNGDYDKVVAHCRVALDPIRKKFNGLKDWIKSGKSLEDWSDGTKFTTHQWLDYQFKLLADITNKTHHAEPFSFGHFSRADAEAIYLVTAGVVSMGERVESPFAQKDESRKNTKPKKTKS